MGALNRIAAIVLLLGAFSFVPVHAAQIGPAFHNGNSTATIDFRNVKGTYFDSISAFTSAVNSYLALCDDPGTGGTVTFTSSQVRVETVGVDCGNRQWSAGGTYYFGANFPADPDCDTAADWSQDSCPPLPTCDESITGVKKWLPGWSGGSVCDESSQCVLSISNTVNIGSSDLVEFTGTADSCTAEPNQSLNPQPGCISSGGDTFCVDADLADQNCGMLNGEYINGHGRMKVEFKNH